LGKAFIEELKRALGAPKVVTDPAIVSLYSREPTGLSSETLAVAFPDSASDVSKVLSLAYKYEVPVYPQGSTTDLSGGALPEGGVVVSFERMNKVLNVSVLDSTADVEAGVRLGDLNVELSRYNYMFPVDPGSVSISTVGGAVNAGAGGLRGAKYGTMRDWVLGLTIVLPDEKGSIVRVGCRTSKCRQGYDLVRLIVGSEGTLAVVTEATLKITPLPEATVVSLAFFPTLEGFYEAYREIKSSGVQPLMMEFMDSETVEIARRTVDVGFKAEGNMFLVAVDCNIEAVPRIERWLEDVMRRSGAKAIYTAKSMEEAEEMKLIALRRNLFASQIAMTSKLYPGRQVVVHPEDIAVPPSRLLEAIRAIRAVSEEMGLKVSIGGHVGDGNIHPAVGYPLDDEAARRRVYEWYREIARISLKLGGTVSAEHGVGIIKKDLLRMELEYIGGLKALELMRSIKRVFDPKNILNPGKVV
jgi:FAD/FMN-containing dehydrogenases